MRRYLDGLKWLALVVAIAISSFTLKHQRKQDQLIAMQQQTIARLNEENLREEMRVRVCEAARAGKVPSVDFDRSMLNMHPELMTPPFKRIPIPATPPPSEWH
jgi:hypothetical protein